MRLGAPIYLCSMDPMSWKISVQSLTNIVYNDEFMIEQF